MKKICRNIILFIFLAHSSFSQYFIVDSLSKTEFCLSSGDSLTFTIDSDSLLANDDSLHFYISLENIYTGDTLEVIHVDSVKFAGMKMFSVEVPLFLPVNDIQNGFRYTLKILNKTQNKISDSSEYFDIVLLPDKPNFKSQWAFCQNDEVVLFPNDSINYYWLTSLSTDTLANWPHVNSTNSGIHTVFIGQKNACGCSEPQEIKITVLDSSEYTPSISSSMLSGYYGENIILSATGCNSEELIWSDGNADSVRIITISDSVKTYFASCLKETCVGSRSNLITINQLGSNYCQVDSVNDKDFFGLESMSFNSIYNSMTRLSNNHQVFNFSEVPFQCNSSQNSLTLALGTKDFPKSINYAVWIDSNRDEYFAESERIYISTSPLEPEDSITIQLPHFPKALSGISRLRIRTISSDQGQILDPCYKYPFSQTTDLVLNLVNTPCPNSIQMINPTDNIYGGHTTYKAINDITSNVQISGNESKIIIQAGKSILLNPGFETSQISKVLLQVAGCN